MWSINYLVQNTQYRLFTAYSDPEAYELGTIYQACNFIYLGKQSGRQTKYLDNGKWVSDRKFRSVASYKRYAKEAGFQWGKDWSVHRRMQWENIPEPVVEHLRAESKIKMAQCEVQKVEPKHKYCYIKGRTKKETRELKKLFYELNPKYRDIRYPKIRGE